MNSIPPHILQHFETQKAHFKANLCRQICLQVDELFQSFLQELKTSSSSDVVAAAAGGRPRTPETYHSTLMDAGQLKIYPNSVATTVVQTHPQPPPRPNSTRTFNRIITANHSHPPAHVVVPLSPLVEIKSEPEDNLVVNISEGGFEEKSMPVAAAGPSSLKTDSDCECSECNPEDEDEDEYEEEQFPVDIKPGEEQGHHQDDVVLFQNHAPRSFKRQRITSRPVQIYTCSLPSCGAQFTRKHDLQFHRRIHTTAGQMKNYDCSECGKSFANASNLSRHKFAHSGLRPHRCTWNGCNYVSAERHNVLRHVRTLHFQLPATQWEQREFGIEDDRDPAVWVETRWDLVERGAGGLASGSES